MQSGDIALNGNTLTIGESSGSPGTLTYTNGNITGTGTLTRYFDGTSYTGTSNDETRFPFGSSGNDNSIWVGASSSFTGGAVSAAFSPSYSATTSLTSYTDNTVTVDRRNNSSWTLSGIGISSASSIFEVTIRTSGIDGITDISGTRISQSSGTGPGSHGSASGTDVSRTGISSGNLGSSFYLAGNSATNQLPVSFSEIRAKLLSSTSVLIDWSTEIEINNEGFEIQQSTDGIDFTPIGFVAGHGNSMDKVSYSFEARNLPEIDVVFFRIRQIDYDGKSEYSQTVSVALDYSNGQVSWFPNPASNDIFMSAGVASRVQLFDLTGRNVLDVNTEKQSNVDLIGIERGSYVIMFLNSVGEIISQDRLIKN